MRRKKEPKIKVNQKVFRGGVPYWGLADEDNVENILPVPASKSRYDPLISVETIGFDEVLDILDSLYFDDAGHQELDAECDTFIRMHYT